MQKIQIRRVIKEEKEYSDEEMYEVFKKSFYDDDIISFEAFKVMMDDLNVNRFINNFYEENINDLQQFFSEIVNRFEFVEITEKNMVDFIELPHFNEFDQAYSLMQIDVWNLIKDSKKAKKKFFEWIDSNVVDSNIHITDFIIDYYDSYSSDLLAVKLGDKHYLVIHND